MPKSDTVYPPFAVNKYRNELVVLIYCVPTVPFCVKGLVEPICRESPVGPVNPVGPVKPVVPVGPVGPVTPVGPIIFRTEDHPVAYGFEE